MSPELEHHFFAAADLDPAAQRAYLDEHCPDPALRRQVESLLAADAGASEKLSAAVAGLALQLSESTGAEAVPGQVGAYRIIRPAGHSATGTVFEAEAFAGTDRQRVALKLVPRALRHGPLAARFENERLILRRLDHPYVGRLLVESTAEDGTPFLVLELLSGPPIDRWCAERGAQVPEVLAVFLKVCEAVAHVHRQGVTHGNLAAANVLMTEAGDPKLTGFGCQRLADGIVPGYASPEVLNGGVADQACDIYGLGCLLYLLLTDRLPYGLNASALRSGLTPELDRVLRRCLRRNASQRYVSVAELVADLQPVLAGMKPPPPKGLPAWWKPAAAGAAGATLLCGLAWWWSAR